jgi:pimeloyl-ACP methyl ester carboxylesterase
MTSRMAEGLVDVDGVELFVHRLATSEAAADAPTIVFLHDSLGCITTWRDFPSVLARRVRLDAIVYDRRGYGRSAPFSGESRPVDYLTREADTLFALLDRLAIERVVLFGHSDGGSIALIAAALRPDRVAAVVTEGAHVFVEEQTLAGIRDAQASFATTDLAERLARHHGDRVPAIMSAWFETWFSAAFRRWNVESLLPAGRCPALIIQGSADEFGTMAQVRAIERGWGGRAEALMLPGVGHTPHRDAREPVLEASVSFLGSLGGSGVDLNAESA